MTTHTQEQLNDIWSAILAGKYGNDPLAIAPRRIAAEPGTEIMSIPNATGTDVFVYERKSGEQWREVTYSWPEWPTVQTALESPRFKWRTIEGIAKETKLDAVTVVGSLSANASVVIKSTIPDQEGRDLFTTKDHYREKSSLWERLESAITNKVQK
ncbi:hypothetical protein [Sulfuriferula multivorans]|uniref:hypothetical protein n=1 Tax=Sulfuriferula multivorans TaxID=1559896 RepID=UPI000F5BA769|nr:hypothetical protein [Sulfuriferula multivorans]